MCVIGPFFDGHRKGLLSAEWLPFGLAPHRWKFKLITCVYLFIYCNSQRLELSMCNKLKFCVKIITIILNSY